MDETIDAQAGDGHADASKTYLEAAPPPSPQVDDRHNYVASASYRRMKLLGEGGLGKVWLARDERVDREVAIKELHPNRQSDPELRARFLREAAIGARLQHPNIAPFFQIGIDDDENPFIVMQRIGGETLEDKVLALRSSDLNWSRRRSELHQLLTLLSQVCDGVAYAHSRGVIHRDLKPSNIMTGEFGEVFVLDWGLGKQINLNPPSGAQVRPSAPGDSSENSAPSLTQSGELMGTLAYMAPEQASGADIGPAADVFGLGGILFFILTGHPPREVNSATLGTIARRIREAPTRQARDLNPATPRRLAAVAAKALALQPDQRYASATDLANDLRRWLAREPVSACAESVAQKAVRWSMRHRAISTSIVAFFAFMIVMAAVVSISAWRNRELRELQEFGNLARQARIAETAITSVIRRLEDHLRFLGLSSRVHTLASDLVQGDAARLAESRAQVAELFVQTMIESPDIIGMQFAYPSEKAVVEIVRTTRTAANAKPRIAPTNELADVGDMTRIERAIANKLGEIYVTKVHPPHFGRTLGGGDCISVAGSMPIFARDHLAGVVVVEFDFGGFLRQLFESSDEPGRIAYIANDHGRMLLQAPSGQAPSLMNGEEPGSLKLAPELENFLAEQKGQSIHKLQTGVDYLAYCSRLQYHPLHTLSLVIGKERKALATAPPSVDHQAVVLLTAFVSAFVFLIAIAFVGLWRIASGLD